MMRSFSAAVSIRAPKEVVWPILTDAAAYADWNPVIERMEGAMSQGGTLTVYPRQQAQRNFTVIVEEVALQRKMVWRRHLPFGSLVGTRTFLVRPNKDGVEFEMREVYTGWLAHWLRRVMPDWQLNFEQFAVALKKRAESN